MSVKISSTFKNFIFLAQGIYDLKSTVSDSYALIGYKGDACKFPASWIKEKLASYPGVKKRHGMMSDDVDITSTIPRSVNCK